LIATWELTKTESELDDIQIDVLNDSNNQTDKKTEKEADIILQFGENNQLDLVQFGDKSRVKYSLRDSILTIGSRNFKIIELSNTKLVLMDPKNLFSKNDIYIKTDKKIEPVKELELVEKKYDNGQLRLKGTLRNGIEDGLWTEWYENGIKKSERYFMNGLPSGTWKEWDDKGKLVKERKWN